MKGQIPTVVWPPNLPDPFILSCSKGRSESETWGHISSIPYIDYVLCPTCRPALTILPNIGAQAIPGTQIHPDAEGYTGTVEQLAQKLQRAEDQGDDDLWMQRLIDAAAWRRDDYELARQSMFPIEQKRQELELEEQQWKEEQQHKEEEQQRKEEQQHKEEQQRQYQQQYQQQQQQIAHGPAEHMHRYTELQLAAQSATQTQMDYDFRARGGRNRRTYDDDDDDDEMTRKMPSQ